PLCRILAVAPNGGVRSAEVIAAGDGAHLPSEAPLLRLSRRAAAIPAIGGGALPRARLGPGRFGATRPARTGRPAIPSGDGCRACALPSAEQIPLRTYRARRENASVTTVSRRVHESLSGAGGPKSTHRDGRIALPWSLRRSSSGVDESDHRG